MNLLRIPILLLLILLNFNVASAEQSQQKEQVEYSFITLKDSKNILHLADDYNYPDDKDEYILVASMISQNSYTLGQLQELDRVREDLFGTFMAD